LNGSGGKAERPNKAVNWTPLRVPVTLGVMWKTEGKIMPFFEIELKKIEKFVGGLCQKKTPEKYKNELRFEFRINNHDVIIYEIRPRWDNPQEITELEVAKLKFNRTKGVWKLYWKRASGKWQIYEPSKNIDDLAKLVEEIGIDEFGCFFG
jgi:hypothetical protein